MCVCVCVCERVCVWDLPDVRPRPGGNFTAHAPPGCGAAAFPRESPKPCTPATDPSTLLLHLEHAPQDGSLSDEELNDFQQLCFGQRLNEDELASVKAMVAERMPEGISDAVRRLCACVRACVLARARARVCVCVCVRV